MNEKSSVKKNFILNSFYQVIKLIVPLITAPYVARTLGVANVGIYSYYHAVVMYFVLAAEMGTFYYAQREVAYNRNDINIIREIFNCVLFIRFVLSFFSLLIYYFFIFMFLENKVLAVILGFNIMTVFFDISWYYQAMEQFKNIVLRNITIKIITIIYILAFIKDSEDLLLYASGLVVLNVLGAFSLWSFLPVGLIDIHNIRIQFLYKMKEIIAVSLPLLLSQLYMLIDKTMIGILTNNAVENGLYEQAQNITKVMIALITSLGVVLAPRIANSYKNKQNDKLKEYLTISYKYICFIAIPISMGISAISNNLIPWFYGDSSLGVIPILQIFCYYLFFNGLTNAIGIQFLISINNQKIVSISIIVGIVLNIFMNYFFITCFGAIGAAASTVISEAITASIEIAFVLKRIHIIELCDVIRPFIRYLLGGVMMYATVSLSNAIYLKKPSVLFTFLDIVIGICVYFIFLFATKDDFWFIVRDYLKKKIILSDT